MTKLSVADSSGAYQTAAGLWVADPTGTYKPAVAAWAADANGTYQQMWPYGPSISSVSVVQGSPAWSQLIVSCQANSAVRFELYMPGVYTAPIYSGTTPSFPFSGAPNNTFTFRWRAYDAAGHYADSAAFTGKTAPLPTPANFRQTGFNDHQIGWAWDAVPGVDGYELDNMAAVGTPSVWSGTTAGVAESGLSPSTSYSRAVRARVGFAFSALSSTITVKTSPAPGPAAGRYQFPATSMHAWAPGYGYWRPSSDGAIHGNGDNWGGSNGNQVTLFTYNVTSMRAALGGGRVTRFQVEIHRDSSAGYSAPQLCHWAMCPNATVPAGAPFFGSQTDAGSLGWGASAVIDLPVSWGQALIDNAYGISSVLWGGVAGRYMRGPQIAAQGTLWITIG